MNRPRCKSDVIKGSHTGRMADRVCRGSGRVTQSKETSREGIVVAMTTRSSKTRRAERLPSLCYVVNETFFSAPKQLNRRIFIAFMSRTCSDDKNLAFFSGLRVRGVTSFGGMSGRCADSARLRLETLVEQCVMCI